MSQNLPVTKRRLLTTAAAAVTAAALPAPFIRRASAAPMRIGVYLPYSGVFTSLGTKITNALELALAENNNKLGGREVELLKIDSEADPSKAPERMVRFIGQGAEIIIGPVHSGVALGMIRVLQNQNTTLIIPNAGAGAATGELCAPNIFRTSFTNWQPAWPMGKIMHERGARRAMSISWNYAAGQESVAGLRQGFEENGGEIVDEILAPFPTVEFQSYMPEIAASDVDAVYTFFSGASAVQFIRQYHEAGLDRNIPLYAVGFLTEGTLDGLEEIAEGLETTMHYADDLPLEANRRFRAAYQDRFDTAADVYAVQGYDTGRLLVHALAQVDGDTGDAAKLQAALRSFEAADSPRGAWRFSRAQNPIQDIYLRRVSDGINRYQGVAAAQVEDPATGCAL
ncbi:MAG: ABC transporter substrate-binding protein [Alphaproteobacteria bacterium]|nr:ABC transporter substrate-binding protein [Alphaproteobacteria bacterium]